MTSCTTNIPTVTGDSPLRGYRTGPYTNNPGDIKDRRAELRFDMHKKVTSLSFEEFMDEFVPDTTTLEPAPPATGKNLQSSDAVPVLVAKPVPCPKVNPFKDIGEYANERAMYGLIVSYFIFVAPHSLSMRLTCRTTDESLTSPLSARRGGSRQTVARIYQWSPGRICFVELPHR